MSFNRNVLCFLTLLILVFASVSFAQETKGNIEGVVSDENGAVVPGITVTITSVGTTTGLKRNVVTKEDGSFSVQQINPGTYSVETAEAKGFGVTKVSNVVVRLGKTATVNLTVKPGVSATVDITSTDNTSIDVTDQKIQSNITQAEFESVPKGTNFISLLKVAPAVRNEPTAGGIQIDGASGSENTFVID